MPQTERLLSWPEVKPLIGNLSRTTWWRAIQRGDAPPPIQITPGRKAWPETVIAAWIKSRIEEAA